MWELINIEVVESDSGHSASLDTYYVVSNGVEEKWLDEYTYMVYKKNKLIKGD